MIQQARTFADHALSNPVPFQIIVQRYEDTVENLPLVVPDMGSLPYRKRRDALEELGEKYQYYKDRRSDIDFVLRNLLSFGVYREQSVEELQATRQALQADFAGCSRQINEIERAARACLESPETFDLPTEYFQPKVALPNLGDEFMSMKQLEQSVRELQQRLEGLQSGIRNGSIVVQKAEMLQARDNWHWMRWKTTDAMNRDIFELWRGDDTWHSTITTNATQNIACSQEFHWGSGMPPVKMWHSSHAVAFLTRVCGDFRGGGEVVNVAIGDGGYWYLGGNSLSEGGVEATARCIGIPHAT
jgi:hypothetical protein